MEFKERKIDFQEADRRYDELVQKRDAGSISQEEFDAERKRLMVLDKQGRWWAKSGTTGEWNYHDGNAWVRGVPPGYQRPAGEEPTKEALKRNPQAEERVSPLRGSQAREVVDGDEGRRSRAPLWRSVLILAFLSLVLFGGVAYVLTRGTSETSAGGENIEVPDLVGASSVEEAQGMVGGDFEVVEADGVESREPIGAVVEQDPASGERIGEGSSILVSLSKGVSLPDVEGETRDDAVQSLEEAGFAVEERTEGSSAEDEGLVTGQDPRGGKDAEAGSTVEITVGEGPGDTGDEGPGDTGDEGPGDAVGDEYAPVSSSSGQVPVPDVIGEDVEEAKLAIESAGFDYTIETVQSDQTAGTVVSTDPAPDTPLDPSSSAVIIRQSSGPPAVEEQTPPAVEEQSPPVIEEQVPPVEEQPPPVVEEQPPPVEEQVPPVIEEQVPPVVEEQVPPVVEEQAPEPVPPAGEEGG